MTHPYNNLPEERYWKTGVSGPKDGFASLWVPKFTITRRDQVLTAGSCFAQHISARLKAENFNWIEAERPDPMASVTWQSRHGYGAFSFRTGNIYTSKMFRQWIDWSEDQSRVPQIYIEEAGRFFDPFRPSIVEEGFGSADELLRSRNHTLSAMNCALRTADVFIFTLGLTEQWRHKSGYYFPVCPGTIRGAFDPNEHEFVNLEYEVVKDDLVYIVELLNNINPGMKFILTVSPVPLTATASEQHVLAATTYSKATLRAVAGSVAKVFEKVDYFPSYEIVMGPQTGYKLFEKNLRSVTSDGISQVMRYFIGKMLGGDHALSRNSATVPHAPELLDDDLVCEELIYEQALKEINVQHDPNTPILVGDSQMAELALGFHRNGVAVYGGGIMHGSKWHRAEFDLDNQKSFIPHHANARSRWSKINQALVCIDEAPSATGTIITNIGMHQAGVYHCIGLKELFEKSKLEKIRLEAHVAELILDHRKKHLDVLFALKRRGCRIICIGDPPSETENSSIFELINRVLIGMHTNAGFSVVDARKWVVDQGGYDERYVGPDWIHGSDRYYADLASYIEANFLFANKQKRWLSVRDGIKKWRAQRLVRQ